MANQEYGPESDVRAPSGNGTTPAFSTIEACDVEEAEAKLLRTADLKITPPCRIGFRA